MMKTWVMFMTLSAVGTGVGATAAGYQTVVPPAPARQAAGCGTGVMPIDTCVRVCLNCDRTGNIVACALCATCSQPALTGSTN
jgi:hypothetical protein